MTEESKLKPESKQEKLDRLQAKVNSLGERLMQAQKAIIEKRREARKADHDV